MHIRLFNFNETKLCGGIKFNGAGVRLFAHHLLVHLGFRWHIDDEIAKDLGLAGEAAARCQPA